jgi:ERCC4-type nuclease
MSAPAAVSLPLRPTPYVVCIDTREQLPYQFARPLSGPRRKRYTVQTTVTTLPTGDYSLAGCEGQVSVERKSLSDLYSTLGAGRVRFLNELERFAAYQFSAVVVEAEWSRVLAEPPKRSRLVPKTIVHSVLAWQQRFPRTHWWFVPGREVGEVVTLRILDRFWRETNR